ncbi:MAG: SMC-Scp complex subunit ScpB [Thermoguttaceae bacterium]|nr:SMC-Scp complex subunit ScpB [Thermoguttaceae bacterium]MDW8038501.1 SMC-Scp complex subunit ScpB [Thermoguttaceae bacterium]
MDDVREDPGGEEQLSLRALSEALNQLMARAAVSGPEGKAPGGFPPIGGQKSPHDWEGSTSELGNLSPASSDSATVSKNFSPSADQPEPVELSPLTILEALLFVGHPDNRPIEPEMAASVMRNVRPEEIPELVRELNRRYEAAGCPYYIVSQGRGYRMTLRKPFWHLRQRFYARIRESKLSQAAIDVLAIVAYQQPVTAEQVEQLRGKPSRHILSHLVQRQLLRIERPQDATRKPYYYTTQRFLRLFGLESLEDLPKAEDIEKR